MNRMSQPCSGLVFASDQQGYGLYTSRSQPVSPGLSV